MVERDETRFRHPVVRIGGLPVLRRQGAYRRGQGETRPALLAVLHAVPPVVWMVVIFLQSAQPASAYRAADAAARGVSEVSYLVHMLLYFVLALLIVRALGRGKSSIPWLRAGPEALAAVAVVVSLLYGVSDEWHQEFVEGRGWSALDLVADLLGATASAALWVAWRRWTPRLVPAGRRSPDAGGTRS